MNDLPILIVLAAALTSACTNAPPANPSTPPAEVPQTPSMSAAPSGQTLIQPSFDCGKAESAAEQMVCNDAQVATIDVELSRLYGLALSGPNLKAGSRNELEAAQMGWIRGRNDCGKENENNRRKCIADQYVSRIHELRQNYAGARSNDAKGISKGPFVGACPGLDTPFSVVFVNADPPMASLRLLDRYSILTAAPAGSGVKYARNDGDGEIIFWEKGDEALFQMPGKKPMTCRISKSASSRDAEIRVGKTTASAAVFPAADYTDVHRRYR